MRKNIVILFVGLLSCSKIAPTEFSEKAKKDVFISIYNNEVTFNEILSKNKGKKILIDVWASWCKDCLKGLPNVKNVQEEYPEVVYVFLSLDRDKESWKNGIKRLKVKGQHYYIQSGWEGDFGAFLGLDWIPRYLVIDQKGKIDVFNATKVTDSRITKSLEKKIN
ncbi:MAG: TlpA family protein disulfide reductase [Tenacibaculum sp.]